MKCEAELLLGPKLYSCNIKLILFERFMPKCRLNDGLMVFKPIRKRNVRVKWQTSTECTGAKGPAGTAAVFPIESTNEQKVQLQCSTSQKIHGGLGYNKEKFKIVDC